MKSVVYICTKLPAPAEYAQQKQEQIDEIEIQHQRAKDCDSPRAGVIGGLRTEPLDLLSIPGDQADEDQHARVGDDPVQRGALEKEIDQRGQDQADQRHEQQAADSSPVALR